MPFLIFAIGLSRGAQKMNGIMQDMGRGTHKYVAARYEFRRMFMAGLSALLTNVVGLAVLMIFDIPAIKGPGADHQYRSLDFGLHQAVPGAGGIVVHRREPDGGPAQLARG